MLAAGVGQLQGVPAPVAGVLAAGHQAALDQLVHQLRGAGLGEPELPGQLLLRARAEQVERGQHAEVPGPQAGPGQALAGQRLVAEPPEPVVGLGHQVLGAGHGGPL